MFLSLQFARGLAAIAVVLFHLGGVMTVFFDVNVYSSLFYFGDKGVEFFFVLSGFIIYIAHKDDLNNPEKCFGYLYKRLIRIYPTYIIIFLLLYVVVLTYPQLQNGEVISGDVLLKALLLIPQDKAIVGGTGAPILPVAWTLQYEVMFYILFIIPILSKKASYIAIIVFIIGYIYGDQISDFYYLSFVFSDYTILFFMGIIVAYVYNEYNLFLSSWRFLLISFSMYMAILLNNYLFIIKFNETITYGVLFSLCILVLINLEKRGVKVFNVKIYQLLGKISFSLYLLHYPIMLFLCKVITTFKFNYEQWSLFIFIFIFIFSIIVSAFFSLFVEIPILNKMRYFYYKNKVKTIFN